MSAAQPADPVQHATTPTDDTSPRPRPGRRGVLRAVRDRWQHPTTPTDDPTPEPAERSAVEEFADTIETSFNEIGHSLTDPDAAAVFLRTLDLWERALEGSHAQGIIDAGQLQELGTVIQGMREAPRLL
ncbi:hypothetical protein [Streptomyces sp. AD55]|uniref:hypothetical protein n=1 Tax=Streptomyces sp. AD55 TaxID=3242895 RepID=UPI003527816E